MTMRRRRCRVGPSTLNATIRDDFVDSVSPTGLAGACRDQSHHGRRFGDASLETTSCGSDKVAGIRLVVSSPGPLRVDVKTSIRSLSFVVRLQLVSPQLPACATSVSPAVQFH